MSLKSWKRTIKKKNAKECIEEGVSSLYLEKLALVTIA